MVLSIMAGEIDIKALRYFLAVARHAGYSRAASGLRITQPAISRQVQALERVFNTRLFRREGRLFLLTDAGDKLAQHARDIVGRVDQLTDIVGIAASEPAGRLSIGMPWMAGEYLLPRVVQRYRKRYPQVFLNAVQGYSDGLADALVRGELDLAVLYGKPRSAELTLTPLIAMELGLVAPPVSRGYAALGQRGKVTFEEALSLPLIMPSSGHGLRDLVERMGAAHKHRLSIVMEADNIPLLRSLIENGLGCSILAFGAVHEHVRARRLRFFSIHTPNLPWTMSLAVRKDKPVTPAVKAMMSELTIWIRRAVLGRSWRGRLIG